MLTFEQLLFYSLATVLITSCTLVITLRNPVRCALFLVLAFINTAIIWLSLEAEFLALILVLVYVGAVMTLFLFVIMMMNPEIAEKRQGFAKLFPLGLLIVGLLVALMMVVIAPENFGLASSAPPAPQGADFSDIKQLGSMLYTDYVLEFELAGVILLVAIISAITLSFRGPQNRLRQRVPKQIKINRRDRVRLVRMKSEDEV